MNKSVVKPELSQTNKIFILRKTEKNMEKVKKIKLETKDPFKILHSDVHSLILKQLKVEDYLKASEVSTLWHDLTANDPNFIANVKLNFTKTSVEDSQTVTPSKRCYENVVLNLGESSDVEVLTAFAESVVNLEIDGSGGAILNSVQFPMLEKLKVTSGLLQNPRGENDVADIVYLCDLYRGFPAQLRNKQLDLGSVIIDISLLERIVLDIQRLDITANPDNDQLLFQVFKALSKSLIHLELDNATPEIVNHIFSDLPNLRALRFRHSVNDWTDLNLEIHQQLLRVSVIGHTLEVDEFGELSNQRILDRALQTNTAKSIYQISFSSQSSLRPF